MRYLSIRHSFVAALRVYKKNASLWHFKLKQDAFLQVNPAMVPRFESSGLTFTGKDETGQRMEVKTDLLHHKKFHLLDYNSWHLKIQIIELPNHPFYVGAQFHPEYKSRPGKPSPLFLGEEKHKNNAKALGFFLRVSTYLN